MTQSLCSESMRSERLRRAQEAFAMAQSIQSEQVCSVRCAEGEESMSIRFSLGENERSMIRRKDENVGSTLARLSKTLNKPLKGKQPPSQSSASPDKEIWLTTAEGARIPEDRINQDAWKTGDKLSVGSESWTCIRNHPTITSFQVKQFAVQGFAVQPSSSTEFVDSIVCRFYTRTDDASWTCVLEGEDCYIPRAEDVGKFLMVEALPIKSGPNEELIVGRKRSFELAGKVQASADLSVYAERLRHVADTQASEDLRVVSYNLLADNTPAERDGEYDFCSSEALDINYRKQLFTWELVQYNADMICLQEVTPHIYTTYMEPQMRANGWTGVYCNKNFAALMGCAVFFKTDKFEMCSEHRVDLFREWTENKEIKRNLHLIPESVKVQLNKANTVGQILELRYKDDSAAPFFVLNTHLMGHPSDKLGRVIQVSTLLHRLRMVVADTGSYDAGVIFCGDFNSSQEEAMHELLKTGRLSSKHKVWGEGEICRNKKSIGGGFSLTSDMSFYRGASHVPATYIDTDFTALVDFIYFSKNHFEMSDSHFPNFPISALRDETSIPSSKFGSDHIALVQDLRVLRSECN
eukprot:CAMPEP_0181332270 /NCGR_PEP_ID=MMETSP1101-20121128/24995_1 /TAXON_ID=46948 /ORGANISM="Rhodomonas abbreviata, Strain Caron Lab Isolate" /LENGTH=579 /DNA_ID=CAMNT_0023441885 /DNA_START=16 /DNA_END=1755 /DNA_ORIENTATION=+